MVQARPFYAATCRLIPQRPATESEGLCNPSGPIHADSGRLRTELALVTSTEVLRAVVQRLGLARLWNTELTSHPELAEHEAIRRRRSQFTVSTPSDTYLIESQVEGTDPLLAAEIANALAEAYQHSVQRALSILAAIEDQVNERVSGMIARLWRPSWATPTCGLGLACCLGR